MQIERGQATLPDLQVSEAWAILLKSAYQLFIPLLAILSIR